MPAVPTVLLAALLAGAPLAGGEQRDGPDEGGLRLIVPNGGEYWTAGEVHQIHWTSGSPGLSHSLIYSNLSNAGPWNLIASNVSAPYNWSVPNDRTNSAWVRVEARNASGGLVEHDISDAPFTIERAPEKRAWIAFPNGGERFANGSAVFARWDSEYGPDARAALWVTCSGAASDFALVAENLPPAGQQLWAANRTGGECLFRLRVNDSLVEHVDLSDSAFQVYEPPRVEIGAPASGSSFRSGGLLTLRWNSSGGASRLLVDVLASWRGEPFATLASGLEDPKRLEVVLPDIETENASLRVEVRDELGNRASDEVRNLSLSKTTPDRGAIRGFLSTPQGPVLNGAVFLYLYSNDSPPVLLQAGTSGHGGNFTFVQLSPGLYLIEAQLGGYEKTGTVVGVVANRTTWTNITLRPTPRPDIQPAEAWLLAVGLLLVGVASAGLTVLWWYWRWRWHPEIAKAMRYPDPRKWFRRRPR
jgi:hypothetical protein